MPYLPVLKPYRESLLRLIYPAFCGSCQRTLTLEESEICLDCRPILESLKLGYADRCLELSFKYVDQAWSLYAYESPLKEILQGVKFHHRRWLLKIFEQDLRDLGALIASQQNYDLLVPIPLDKTRLMDRQFNQSDLIARPLSAATGLKIRAALRKRRPTPAQSRLHREDRLKNLHYAFDSNSNLTGKRILLADDILTTGATAEEAARVLKENGALRVDLAVLACSTHDLPQSARPNSSRLKTD